MAEVFGAEDRGWPGLVAEVFEDRALDLELLRSRLEDEIGIGDGFEEIRLVAEIAEPGLVLRQEIEDRRDTLGRRSEDRRIGIVQHDGMPGRSENLRNAMAHQPGADDGDFFGH